MLLKTAHKLNYKTLYPSNLEHQKVSLECNIFCDSTYAALKTELDQNSGISDGTVEFVRIILQWWSIVNIKSKLLGNFKRNKMIYPFESTADERLEFLRKFLLWLEKWKTSKKQGLTTDTHAALYQCTSVIIQVIEYSLEILKIDYVLPGKLQPDNLEKRFSCYRQLSGGNYNISVNQILEVEKKLRIKGFLGLKSAKYGQIKFSLDNNEEAEMDDFISDHDLDFNLDQFDTSFNFNDITINNADTSSILYIAGYTAYKLKANISCHICLSKIVSSDELGDEYFMQLDRGALIVPTKEVVAIAEYMICVVTMLISKEYETKFLQHGHQKQL